MKRMVLGVFAASLVLSLAGCGLSSKLQGGSADEILTTKAVDQDKTMITVRTENNVADSADLEAILEQQFPDVDFVLVHDGSISSEYTIRADLENGTECDLILSRRLNNVSDIAPEYLLDLSSESFVDTFFMSAVDSCTTEEGKVYYLPGPSNIYGIVYDTVMFEENGWEVPQSYSEFVELLDTIREADISVNYTDTEGNRQKATVVPIQPSMMYPDMFQIMFNTYGYDEVYKGVKNYKWLMNYQKGTGSMVGHMEPAVETFEKLFEDGILSVADWDVAPVTRSNMMYVYHTTAMVIECQDAPSYAKTFAESTEGAEYHEVAMMPFWTSDNPDSDYVYSIPSYFMAINKASAEESQEKKELLLEVYEFLCSAAGQRALIGDTLQVSNVQGVGMEESSFSAAVQDTINKGNIISNFYFAAGETSKQVEKQLRSTTPDLIGGSLSVEDWLLAADQVRDDFLTGSLTEETVYGQVETTLTRLESAYTMAQMYQELTGADIGISYGGHWRFGTNGHFYEGDITDSSLSCVTPDKESPADGNDFDGTIVTTEMTGAQILSILNSGPEGGYYVASGLTVRYDPWAEEGSRVLSCKLPDGTEIDADQTYTVAYFYGSLPAGSPAPEASLLQTWQESFLGWLDSKGGVITKPSMTVTLAYGEGESD